MRSRSGIDLRPAIVAAAIAATAAVAHARVVEEEVDLPVQVTDAYGKQVAQPIKVTVFRDDAAASAKRPAIVINHGRAGDAPGRAALGRARYPEISRWFVEQGFVVAVPTRIGYGVSGGEDVEDSGACASKRYGPGFAAAADETLAVVAWLQKRADVDAERIVALGQSYGGATTVAVAARNPKGVVAAINFAGGSGGDPKNRPGAPCSPHMIERTYADYGTSARVPMLWLYAENDRYWGATYPTGWADAFKKAGGDVRFVGLPPAGDDGHLLFPRFPGTWQPIVAEFLRGQGFAVGAAAKEARP